MTYEPFTPNETGLTRRTATVNGVRLTYLWGGTEGPLVLCLHGFPDTALTFTLLARELVEAGFRVVVPWLRGYPPSQVVDGPYQSAAIARDAIALAQLLSPAQPAYLVGHDWGGVATYGATVLAPAMWARAVVLAVPPSRVFRDFLVRNGDQQRLSWYMFFFQLADYSERVVAANSYEFIGRLWREWSPNWEPEQALLDAVKDSLDGGLQAALSYYRDSWQASRQKPFLAADQQSMFEGPITVPTLILHGLQDGCILPDTFAEAKSHFVASCAVEGVPGVGHFLHLEEPKVINSRILGFLEEGRSNGGG
jgi:pimeloyl-ACP methyl ester carboxylesterase